tara:strand:+ start:10769 stop:11869 length:1101 start_codon:yes stop_codon:yes gene_type:complete
MAFLDNSGDIILDAVLTDTGRKRLAQGDGSFKISKFALGDDEVNYTLYNKTHASGSAYYDLDVLQTPVLEAFTNNTSNMNSRLMSLSRTNVLYMPVLKLNSNAKAANGTNPQAHNSREFSRTGDSLGTNVGDAKYYIAVDADTYTILSEERASGTSNKLAASNVDLGGVIKGHAVGGTDPVALIRVDQGIDNNALSPETGVPADLVETAFIIELDYRFGRIKEPNSNTQLAVNFIDDDNVASYYVTSDKYVNPDGDLKNIKNVTKNNSMKKDDLSDIAPQVFEGPRSTTLQFRVHASADLQSSTYLFTQVGASQAVSTASNILGLDNTNDGLASGKTIYYIDSTIRVTGANTGYRLDIPVRYVKVE